MMQFRYATQVRLHYNHASECLGQCSASHRSLAVFSSHHPPASEFPEGLDPALPRGQSQQGHLWGLMAQLGATVVSIHSHPAHRITV